MTDELNRLRKGLSETPAPDSDRKRQNIAQAMEIFDRAQGTTNEARPNPTTRKHVWLSIERIRKMRSLLSPRAALTATTSVAALSLAVVIYMPDTQLPTPLTFDDAEQESFATAPVERLEADVAAEVAEPAIVQSKSVAAPTAQLADQAASGLSREMRSNDQLIQGGVLYEEQVIIGQEPNTEAYSNAEPNPLHSVAEEPVSTFSIDVDTASYGVVRSYLNSGQLPPADAVRIEEMINYFPYDYPAPDSDATMPFQPSLTLMPTPWNEHTQLLHVGIQGQMPAIEDRPPLNLVFLVDTSGSMNDINKLPLLIQSLRLLTSELRPEDEVAIVTYAGSAGVALEPTPVSDKQKIFAALEGLMSGGSTAGHAGLKGAYAMAEQMRQDGELQRVILATDGDFNVGISDPEELKGFIEKKRDSGAYLSVLGFGRGNLDDATMQALAQNGNGQAAYIDTLNEAQKALSDQLTGALFPIANDVKIQIEFNPAAVAEYRLIGYETRALNREDFNNDKVDAGEIGAGHTVTAIYEITPVGSPAVRIDDLRYQPEEATGEDADELGYFKMRYKLPGESVSKLMETPIANAVTEVSQEVRFSAAIAGFGQLLRDSDFLGNWDYGSAIDLATGARGEDAFGYRSEAIKLMRLATSLDEIE